MNDRFDTDYVQPYKILFRSNLPQLVNHKTFRRVSVRGFKSRYISRAILSRMLKIRIQRNSNEPLYTEKVIVRLFLVHDFENY